MKHRKGLGWTSYFYSFFCTKFPGHSTNDDCLLRVSEIKTDITFAYEINDMKEVSPSRKKKWSRETHFLKPDLWAPSFALNSSVVGMGKCTWMDLFDNFLCKVNGSREPIQNKRDSMNYYSYYYCIRRRKTWCKLHMEECGSDSKVVWTLVAANATGRVLLQNAQHSILWITKMAVYWTYIMWRWQLIVF